MNKNIKILFMIAFLFLANRTNAYSFDAYVDNNYSNIDSETNSIYQPKYQFATTIYPVNLLFDTGINSSLSTLFEVMNVIEPTFIYSFTTPIFYDCYQEIDLEDLDSLIKDYSKSYVPRAQEDNNDTKKIMVPRATIEPENNQLPAVTKSSKSKLGVLIVPSADLDENI